MPRDYRTAIRVGLLALTAPALVIAQQQPPPAPSQGRGGVTFGQAGSLNPDGSLRPARAVTGLFSQNSYTEYSILEPGSASFRIRFLPEETRAGATELTNATRGGSEGSGIEVYDPRTGKPLTFTYTADNPNDPETHTIHAKLPFPVPQGGIGRVLIYKTYKDERTYMMNGEDIVWVRSLSGYRLGVILPKGFAFLSADVAAHVTTTADGRLKLAFANPSGQSNPVTIHARKTTATFPPASFDDMFFDDIKTLYDLGAPETGTISVTQTYSDYRKGETAKLDSLSYLRLSEPQVIDLDTAKPLTPMKQGKGQSVKLDVPITDDKQSAHLKLTGTIKDGSYKVSNGELVFDREVHGLRNTVLLPAGWEVSGASESCTIGRQQNRAFVACINLNATNAYKLAIRARR